MSIHRSERSVKACFNSILGSEKISKEDKDLISRFHNECYSQGLSHTRVVFYLDKLKHICLRWSDIPLHEMSKDSIKETTARIEKNDYSEHTKQGYRVTLKKFFQWSEGLEWRSKEYPDKVKWLRTSVPNNHKKLPEEILTQEDVSKMVKNTNNVRDKALISILYESGCRIGELLTLRLKHVEFDDYGGIIHVHGKTGSRRIRLISSVPHLSNWLNNHPDKSISESYLWVSIGSRNNSNMISYHLVCKILRKTAKKSGIQKKVNPHMFRHSRATHLANRLTEAQMKEYFGWVQGSDMASVYVHLSGRDVDDAILRIHGKLPDKKKRNELEVKECPRCLQENSPETDFCYRCHQVLNEKASLEVDKEEKQFLSLISPKMIEEMIEKMMNKLITKK